MKYWPLLYMNDLTKVVHYSEIVLFVDDVAIAVYCSIADTLLVQPLIWHHFLDGPLLTALRLTYPSLMLFHL